MVSRDRTLFITMLYRPARSETILRFELKRNEFLNLHQQSLAFAEAPVSDLLASRQQTEGMGESMNILLWVLTAWGRERSGSFDTPSVTP